MKPDPAFKPSGVQDLLCVGIGVAVFVVYAIGACRTIYVGDSGELVAAVYTLGIPHPSGYPLYVLLGKLWTILVPLGSIAFRMSLFSAVCAAATVGLLCRLCRGWGLSAVASAGAALLLAFSPSFWSQANVQRVYSLNALFVIGVTSVAFAWSRERKGLYFGLCFFLCGLGACNHTYMAVYAAALFVFFSWSVPALLRKPRTFVIAPLSFAAGLVPYLYLPLRSRMNPRLDWGDPETVSAFLGVVLRRNFWDRAWFETPSDFFVVALDYLRSLGGELFWVGTVFAAVGLVVGWKRRWPVSLPLLVMASNLSILAIHGSRSDIFIWHRYYIPSYLMAALLAALGFQALWERLSGRMKMLPLVLPLIGLGIGWKSFDRSRYRIAEDFSRTLFSTLAPGAHLSATDDNILFVLMYLHLVEGARPDVNLILQGVDQDLPPLRFNPDREPLFFTHHPNWNVPTLEIVPVGLTFQTIRAGQPPPEPVVPKSELDGERDRRVPKDYLTQNLIGHFHFMLGTTFEKIDWLRASRGFEAAKASAPSNDVLFYNLGLIYRRNGLYDEALDAFERSHVINPRHIAGKGRVEAQERVEEVRRELERLKRMESRLSDELERRGITPESTAYHSAMAQLLDAANEPAAAHGQRLRALMFSME